MVVMKPVQWEKAMEMVRASIGEDAFSAWLASAQLEDFRGDDGRLQITVPNEFYRRWIEKRYLSALESAFTDTMGVGVSVQLLVDQGRGSASVAAPAPASPRRGRGTTSSKEDVADLDQDLRSFDDRLAYEIAEQDAVSQSERMDALSRQAPRLNQRYVFDEFVVGESNRYAHAAALAVADPRSKAYNPLFIYGSSGLGKTHLMQAIGHRISAVDPRLKVLYVTSEYFINGFIDAIQNKRHLEFRQDYRNADLLLIDDVQFLMGKERTQTEFFHTFNALYDAGKKVVVTSDRPPKDLAALEERLRSRFEWGLIVDMQPPDLETRVAILRKKAEQEGVKLPSDVILFIAERVTQNIREMEGALKRLRMAASLHERPLDLETARDVLGPLIGGAPQTRVSVEDVQRAVCSYFGIRPQELLGTNRSKKFSVPRHLAQYLCRKMTSLSFPDIAHKFGGKDHTSIIYACRKVEGMLEKDPNMANVVAHLTRQVTKGGEA